MSNVGSILWKFVVPNNDLYTGYFEFDVDKSIPSQIRSLTDNKAGPNLGLDNNSNDCDVHFTKSTSSKTYWYVEKL